MERIMDKDRLFQEIDALLAAEGFELSDLRVLRQPGGKPLIQVFMDKDPGGVTLDDCGAWSDKIGAHLDLTEIVTGGYILEVSSPGVDRALRREKDFTRFAGTRVHVRLKRPVNNSRNFHAELKGFADGKVLLSDGLSFPLEDIDEARIEPDYDEILKKHK